MEPDIGPFGNKGFKVGRIDSEPLKKTVSDPFRKNAEQNNRQRGNCRYKTQENVVKYQV